MLTLTRIGSRIFNLANVQEIDLAYPPARHNATKPPSKALGVQVVLSSGHQLLPFWDSDAELLRDYLEGRPVDANTYPLGPDARVVHLGAATEALLEATRLVDASAN